MINNIPFFLSVPFTLLVNKNTKIIMKQLANKPENIVNISIKEINTIGETLNNNIIRKVIMYIEKLIKMINVGIFFKLTKFFSQ